MGSRYGTLKDECFILFDDSSFEDCRAIKFKDVGVKSVCQSLPWPGKHKNVHIWYKLENGYAVGFNENPARGWSFPVVKLKD